MHDNTTKKLICLVCLIWFYSMTTGENKNRCTSKLKTRRKLSCFPWFTHHCSQSIRQSFRLGSKWHPCLVSYHLLIAWLFICLFYCYTSRHSHKSCPMFWHFQYLFIGYFFEAWITKRIKEKYCVPWYDIIYQFHDMW